MILSPKRVLNIPLGDKAPITMEITKAPTAVLDRSLINPAPVSWELAIIENKTSADDGHKLIKDLDLKLLNTKDRLEADIKANANFSGQSYRLPNTVEEDKARCAFNPDSL